MFNREFKDKVFKVCLQAGLARPAIKALESNNYVRLRNILEDLLDDPHLYVDRNLGNNRKVRPDKVHTLESREEVYSELMELITNQLDSGELLPEFRLHF